MKYVLAELDVNIMLPYFASCILLELICHFVIWNRKLYRFNDTFSSLACGITQQITGKLFTTYYFHVLPYTFVYHIIYGGGSSALQDGVEQLGLTSWYWWFVLIFKDHQYYWAHRYLHEVCILQLYQCSFTRSYYR